MFIKNKFYLVSALGLLLGACADADKDIPTENRISLIELQKSKQAVSNAKINLPEAVLNSDWTQKSGLPFNDLGNLSAINTIKSPQRIYIGDTQSGDYEATMQPVFSAGYGYFFTVDSELIALDLSTKEILWRKDIILENDEDVNPRGGGLAAYGGYVFIATNSGIVAAFDSESGKEIWRFNNKVPFSAAPTLSGGALYVVDRDNRLQVINARQGNALWDYRGLPKTAAFSNVASASVLGPVVVVPFTSGEITAISTTSKKPAWGQSVIGSGLNPRGFQFDTISSEVVISNRQIFVSVPSGVTVALEGVSGKPIWKQDIGSAKNILSVGRYLFLIDMDSTLYALSKEDGQIIWKRQLARYTDPDDNEGMIQWASPIMSNGKIILFSNTEQALVIDAENGDVIENIDDAPETIIDPAIANGKLYLHAKDGYVYIYGPEYEEN